MRLKRAHGPYAISQLRHNILSRQGFSTSPHPPRKQNIEFRQSEVNRNGVDNPSYVPTNTIWRRRASSAVSGRLWCPAAIASAGPPVPGRSFNRDHVQLTADTIFV
jgi:hypothetical protein